MEQNMFILLFFSGAGLLHTSVSYEYHLIQQEKTWNDAQAYCKTNYIDLAIVKSSNDMIQLQNEADRQQLNSSAWIGMYNDITSWRWSYKGEGLGSMDEWAPIEPNNNGGNQECSAMCISGWTDRECTEEFPFICFNGGDITSSSYVYVSDLKTWFEAQSYCRLYYTDLASTRNQSEYNILYNITIINSGNIWFGMFRDGWKWVDQTNFSTINWTLGKPDNMLGNENCGYLNDMEAVDAQCSTLMPFYCYSANGWKRQFIRVKIRSSKDVNNPVLTEDILEQIKQRLKNHGMAERTTVQWRVQADGGVFHKET